MKNKLFVCVCTFYLVFNFSQLSAQHIESMQFQNQEITDILLVLAETSQNSIIPDETVTGKASFYFADSEFEEALQLFLSTYKLYFTKENSIIKVSKIKTSYDADTALVSIKADTVPIEYLIRSLSKCIGKTILYDSLPKLTISIDSNNLPIEEILNIFTCQLTNYKIETTDSYYYIKKIETDIQNGVQKNTTTRLTCTDNLYTLNMQNGQFLATLSSLFSQAELEYSFLIKNDSELQNLYFENKDFQTMLKLILEQGNADYVVKNDIYYIVELQRRDVLKKFETIEILHLTYIQATDIISLMPSELSSSTAIKIDKDTNTVILSGTNEETAPIKDFIMLIDKKSDDLIYKRIDVKYLDAQELLNTIPQNLISHTPVIIPNSNSFIVSGSNESIQILLDYLVLIDKKNTGFPIYLKYIKTDDLLENLPPSVSADSVKSSGYPNLVFFTGTEEKKQVFLNELGLIDRPKPQIRYQLLVIQYTNDTSSAISADISTEPISETTDSQAFSFFGDLTDIMSLNFDVIAQFGYQFAVKLNAQLNEKLANIFTDTTLTALSGQEINFQNTDTYRYQELEINSDTGSTTSTGVTQSITSGLIVSLNGWISGDDMITMTVNATISKQNSNTTSTDSSLPSTSERVVTTQVRTQSGKPVVISGLIKEDTTSSVAKTPFLGDIPILNFFFKHSTKSKNKTEIVIYIVPHLIRESSENSCENLRMERYYQTFIQKNNLL